jgi:hydrogenase maturation protease
VAEEKMKKDVVVVGLGNTLMADEGIGVHLVRRLSDEKLTAEHAETAEKKNEINSECSAASAVRKNVEFIDAGTGGMSLLHIISGRKKAIIIDCAVMGAEPGTIKRFSPEEAKSVKQLSHYSLHEADVLQIIEMSRKLGQCPEQIIIFGIEPQRIEPGRQLSQILSDRLIEYITTVEKELIA